MSTGHRIVHIAQPCMGEEEWQAVRRPIQSGWLTQGPEVAAFEKAFAERHAVRYASAVTSCTAALHLSLAALGVGPGDEVIVPAFTWIATANAVLYCGATPVFVDVDRRTFTLDLVDLRRRLSPRTKAVIPVHLFGLCADIDGLRSLLPDDVAIVEDGACAAGASYKGRPAGGLGTIGTFSFHPRKSITTGEGGMVTTNDDVLAERISRLRNHGAGVSAEVRHSGAKPYLLPDFDELGFNYRMSDLQAALGSVQLVRLDPFVEERAAWAAWYRRELSSLTWLRLPEEPNDGGRHAWQSFVTFVDPATAPFARNEIMQRLQDMGIATRPGTHAVHMLGLYRDRFGIKPDDYPGARDCDRYSMAIPLHNRMTEADYAYVAEALMAMK